MPDLKPLVAAVQDSDSLCDLLRALGWPILPEFPFDEQPEIAHGVKGATCTVRSLVPASSDDPRLFLLVEFHEPYVRRDLREILSSLRRYTRDTGKWEGKSGTGDTIFVVASPGYEDVRFVLFEEQDRRLPRIRSFGWRREFIGRTVLTHNLERLRWDERAHWEHAWDVEALTEKFYKDYEEVFARVLTQVETGPNVDERTKHSWTQLLFNRLLFVAFIQRMGWLRMPGGSRDGFLFDLCRAQNRGKFETLYGMLRAVFAELDTKEEHEYKNRHAEVIGTVPYLNGGLFDQDDPLDRSDISLPDQALSIVLAEPHGLFARYNFTVTESTPLDQEVAVDPEMLGKIFERLIIAEERHKSGTYYTPRPIVEFMVNEAIKGYLVERGLPADKAAMLVDEDRVEKDDLAFRPGEMQDTLDWLFEVRAVDPACGSGAYLLMLLQRLFELVDRLEVSRDKRRNVNQKHLYETKLRLLQRCVYGVDLSETAVRIARLRLWLSLVVENKGEKPEPLPNFDFLIMQGDALASPLFPAQGVLGYPHAEVREYTRMKRLYFHPGAGEKRPTRAEMKAQREKIAAALDDELGQSPLRKLSPMPFDWEVEFAEVFDSSDSEDTVGGRLNLGFANGRNDQAELAARAARGAGFDIVLANPPYVNSGELLRSVGKDYKDALVKAFPSTASGTADLLVYFMDRAVELLRPGGHFAFITSNKWLKAAYGQKLRGHLAVRTEMHHLIDFGDLPVFQGTIAYPLITISTKRHDGDRTESVCRFTSVPSLDAPYPDLPTLIRDAGGELPTGSIAVSGSWNLRIGEAAIRLEMMRRRSIPLGEAVNCKIAKGVSTGLNQAFLVSLQEAKALIENDPDSKELLKPVLLGKDIQKWCCARSAGKYVIYTTSTTQLDEYPAVLAHLSRFRCDLENRNEAKLGRYPWFAHERPRPETARLSAQPKIICPDIAADTRFALDTSGALPLNTAYVIGSDSLFILGVLNSRAVFEWYRSTSATIMNGYLRFIDQYLSNIPIPIAGEEDRKCIESLVQRIIDVRLKDPSADISELEVEIDSRVDFLYFHADGAANFDEWVAKREAEKGTIAEEVRKLIAGDENAMVEFKETLEYVDRIDPNLPEERKNQIRAAKQKERVEGVLKTICAFANSRGGTLLIGVSDKKEVVGLEPDFSMLGQKKDRDGFENKLTDLLKRRITPLPTDIEIDFPELDGKLICRIHVPVSPLPTYCDNRLFIRLGNSTQELEGQALQHWLDRRKVTQARDGLELGSVNDPIHTPAGEQL